MTRREALTMLPAAIAIRPGHAENQLEPLFARTPSDGESKRIALTLDACGGGFDERITAALVKHQVKATIFLTGRWIKSNKTGLGFLLDHPELFSFENHGAKHVPAVLGTGKLYGMAVAGTIDAVRREVEDGAKAIHDVTGTDTSWYRGAAARYSQDAIKEITRIGQRIGAYSLNADQGASLPATVVAARMSKARDGDVLIGHINQPKRPAGAGIAAGIAALKQTGFVFVTLNEMDPREVITNRKI